MEGIIICFFSVNALAGNPLCLTVVLLLAASQGGKAPAEPETMRTTRWTGLILPLLLPAPGQLSLTAGVSSADR